jgi:hypothetical protein
LQNEKKATFEKNEALRDAKFQKLKNEKKASYEKNIEFKNQKLEALKLDHKENHRTVPFSDFPMGQLITVGENGARDGVVSATVGSVDTWAGEIRYMLLKTGDWWIMCPPDEDAPDFTVFGAGAFGTEDFSCSVPAGEYMFVLGDTFGDGGAVADVSVNGTIAGSLNSSNAVSGDWDSDGYDDNGVYEASVVLDVADEDSTDPVASVVTFDVTGVDDCGFVSVTGTFDEWSGWGANTDSGMSATVAAGDHEYAVLCVDTSIAEWWNDIWGASTAYYAPLGSGCDFNPSDEFPNYGFSVDGSGAAFIIPICAGTCDLACASEPVGSHVPAQIGIINAAPDPSTLNP